MSAGIPERQFDAGGSLSRSLFGFALVAWIPLCVTFVLLALAPSSPQSSYAQLQAIIVIVFGAATGLALLGVVWSYRLEQTASARIAAALVRVFGRRWLAIALLVLLVETNFLAQVLLRDIAPSMTEPARFLLFCWSIVCGAILAIVHWTGLRRAFLKHRNALAVSGLVIAVACALLALALLTSRLVAETGLNDQIRGRLDYRQLSFIDDGGAPTAQGFWEEQVQTKVRWLPYSYWVVAPFAGKYINVDEQGLRKTVSIDEGEGAQRVYFFGGSTAWGLGARDDYTIPSHIARLLAVLDAPAKVLNYAQPAYVSTQDLILFQRQLAQGNLPDLAVFYQGFNDTLAAQVPGGIAGVPFYEGQRVSDVEAGRLLRQGQPVLRPPQPSVAEMNWRLVSKGGASAREIFDAWLANRRLIRAVAQAKGVGVLFVWQPALFAKQTLTQFEARFVAGEDRVPPGFISVYRDVDRLVREHALAESWDDVIILSDIFHDVADDIFFDEVHINEIGNQAVAEAIAGSIAERLLAREP